MPSLSDTSPIEPARLAQLYAKPGAFFSPTHVLNRQPELLIVLWVVGMSAVIDRIDNNLHRIELGSTSLSMTASLARRWSYLWIFVALFGWLSAALGWLVGGWWYRVRLEWSGARNPDPTEARLVWLYTGLVSALPAFLLLVIDTFRFENYLESWIQPSLLAIIPAAALFWSVWVSYRAATTRFTLKSTPARMWFLVLPLLLYVVLIAIVGLLSSGASEGVPV